MPGYLLKSGAEPHVFTREDSAKGGRAKAAKYAAQVGEKRRRRRRARYLREREGRTGDWYEPRALAEARGAIDPDKRLCPRCGGVREGRIRPQEKLCSGFC
jgi:hypothetical protein